MSIRASKVKALVGPEPHYRELLGAFALMSVFGVQSQQRAQKTKSTWHTHVQIDLPQPGQPIVTESLVGSSYCSHCKKYHSAEDRVSGSLYGPRLHAQVCYWKYSLGLTFLKIQKLLREQYSSDLSTGQLSAIVTRTANKFENAYDDLKTSLHDQDHLHVDETGWRLDGVNAW